MTAHEGPVQRRCDGPASTDPADPDRPAGSRHGLEGGAGTDAAPVAEQISLDAYRARREAEEGIARSDDRALTAWKLDADRRIRSLADRLDEFTADDVWESGLGPNPTGSNTALGARFRHAVAEGIIENTGRAISTAQVKSHGAPQTVWRSLRRKPATLTVEIPADLAARLRVAITTADVLDLDTDALEFGSDLLDLAAILSTTVDGPEAV